MQAVRGSYGTYSIRNLIEAHQEAAGNTARRFKLAHSEEIVAKTAGRFFAGAAEVRIENTKIDFAAHANPQRYVKAIQQPFRHAASNRGGEF